MKSEKNSWAKESHLMHQKFGHSQAVIQMSTSELKELLAFRIRFLNEELTELAEAPQADDVVDALIDLIVVAVGTLDLFQVDAEKAWRKVYSANMKKTTGPNTSRPSTAIMPDLIKPAGWKAPDHKDNVGLLKQLFPQEN